MGYLGYKKYSYDGPVEEFGRCITSRWQASTYAPSSSKARTNLTYRYKKEYGRAVGAKITLPGLIVEESEDE